MSIAPRAVVYRYRLVDVKDLRLAGMAVVMNWLNCSPAAERQVASCGRITSGCLNMHTNIQHETLKKETKMKRQNKFYLQTFGTEKAVTVV